ncbi:hypothetical protein [Hyphomicrobium sp.]|uniref:hypothetical protein n=1 Tax=Hyphomicrobium sp. TaxID=82 RepID=UPI002E30EC16|nr:hypothetical protein [Hyphomicrobium sp.]HEX2842018.1 hypothetical protein [Hyphomicrobium sp.]
MGYRGDDLELRTPQAAAGEVSTPQAPYPFSAPPRPRTSLGATNGAPIWVDETVLDICNHAYDIASAHRAIEVRLEHLIYALTRTDAAAEALESRGTRVASLRREAASVIATDIPAAQSSGKTTPRRAEAFEELLRIAASHAYRRQAPVGVADVVYALFDGGADFTSALPLLPSVFRLAPLPPAAIRPDAEGIRDRTHGPAVPLSVLGLTIDPASLSSAQTTNQYARIDAIEQAIRALTTELANERKIFSGVLQDLQRELMAQREDTSRLSGITQDKMQAFLTARMPGSDDGNALQERLGLLERALQAEIAVTRSAVEALADKPNVDLSPVLQKIETIETSAAQERERVKAGEEAFSAKIQALAGSLDRQPAEISGLVSNPLVEHLDALARTRDAQHASATDGIAETNRRLAHLEEIFAAHVARSETAAEAAAQERATLRELLERLTETIVQESDSGRETFARLTDNLSQDLSDLHDGLSKVDTGQLSLASTLNTQGQEATTAVSSLLARIENLESASAKPVEMLAALSTTVDKMHKVTVEKYYRRNRFWYWLFGTDDWLAASWPSQSKRVAEELKSLKS